MRALSVRRQPRRVLLPRLTGWYCHGPTGPLIPLAPWISVAKAVVHALAALGLGMAALAFVLVAIVPQAWLGYLFAYGSLLVVLAVLGRLALVTWQPDAISPERS